MEKRPRSYRGRSIIPSTAATDLALGLRLRTDVDAAARGLATRTRRLATRGRHSRTGRAFRAVVVIAASDRLAAHDRLAFLARDRLVFHQRLRQGFEFGLVLRQHFPGGLFTGGYDTP